MNGKNLKVTTERMEMVYHSKPVGKGWGDRTKISSIVFMR